ncbi:hypothetical protein [Nostoc piscinale]|uniref:hypothetical protein n=1 Tax=Nostoc piscinale TaxID=224012 RepID=UPI00130E8973|nr:hypothetical protein [Nostoc piscinale]
MTGVLKTNPVVIAPATIQGARHIPATLIALNNFFTVNSQACKSQLSVNSYQ